MRRYVLPIIFFVSTLYWTGCKKCYQCHDTCKKCVLMDSIFIVSTQVICTDSFSSISAFNAAVSADSAMGYVCTATTSAYNKSFCSNKPSRPGLP